VLNPHQRHRFLLFFVGGLITAAAAFLLLLHFGHLSLEAAGGFICIGAAAAAAVVILAFVGNLEDPRRLRRVIVLHLVLIAIMGTALVVDGELGTQLPPLHWVALSVVGVYLLSLRPFAVYLRRRSQEPGSRGD
jgi:hypothetical protein